MKRAASDERADLIATIADGGFRLSFAVSKPSAGPSTMWPWPHQDGGSFVLKDLIGYGDGANSSSARVEGGRHRVHDAYLVRPWLSVERNSPVAKTPKLLVGDAIGKQCAD